MKGIAIAVIAVCIIAAAGAGVAIAVQSPNPSSEPTYDIIYVTNGGINSGDNPLSYKAGDSFTFKDPTRQDYVFAGWYTDQGLTSEIKGISEDMKGDLTVYAKWVWKTYSITYVLCGGTNSEDNPSSYNAGDSFSFGHPTFEGYIFTGWYSDAEYTDEITGITKNMRGNITVYAQWELSSVGSVMTYSIDGKLQSSNWIFSYTNKITGTVSYSHLYYRYDKGYLMSYDENYTVTYYNKSTKSFSESDTYWSKENSDMDWTDEGITQIIPTINGDKECGIWVGTNKSETETQYIGINDGIAYRMVYSKSTIDSQTSITYELIGVGSIEVDKSYEVKAYCDSGISVTGSGIKDAYSDVTLTATASPGTTFKGWYSATGVLLSTSSTYTISTLLSEMTVYAMNTEDCDRSYDNTAVSISPAIPLTNITWTFDDSGTKTVSSDILNYTFSSAGEYTIKYSGKASDNSPYYGILGLLVDGYVTKTYNWTYDSKDYEATLGIKYSDFKEYRNNDIYRGQGTEEHDLEFVTYDDKYIVSLADDLMTLGAGMTDIEYANFILKFTQYIEYQYDEDSMGQDEYWKFPLETLFDQNGDCEDTSILFCAIAKASGYDCCEILFSGHMAAGIVISDYSGENLFVKNDVIYNYCETTNYDSVGSYIRKYGFVDYGYTQYGKGSLLQNIIPVI